MSRPPNSIRTRCFAAAIAAAAGIFACFGATSARAQDRIVVRVIAENIVEGDRIFLGGISTVTGTDAEASARIGKISLGYAPNIGTSREIRREQIMLAVAAAGFSQKDIALNSPAMVVVRRAGQTISEAAIRTAAETSLLSGLLAENIDARVVKLGVPANIQVPAGTIELRANASAIRNLFAPFSMPIEVRVDGMLVRTFSVSAEIEAFAEILVAARDISAGSPVIEADVRLEKHRIDRPASTYLRDAARLRGSALTRDVRGGSPLTADTLAAVAVIKQGDIVRIEANTGQLTIVVNGEAKAAGRIGDRISVKNTETGKLLQAYVVDKGVVKIAL